MSLSNKDNPVAEPEKPAKKTTEKPEPPRLARASESGDAGVQNLLAQQSIHASNGDDEQVADVDRQLAELGFTAK
jgi:hypothetical protein